MANPPLSTHSPAARSPAPRPAAPRSAEPRSAEPRSAEAVSAGRTLIAASDRTRRRAHVRDLERRRPMIMLAKWVLPAVALALLCTVAAWPEVKRLETSARIAGARVMADVAAARVTGAV